MCRQQHGAHLAPSLYLALLIPPLSPPATSRFPAISESRSVPTAQHTGNSCGAPHSASRRCSGHDLRGQNSPFDSASDAINIANSVQPDGSNIVRHGAIPRAKSRRRSVDSELGSCRPTRKFKSGIDPRDADNSTRDTCPRHRISFVSIAVQIYEHSVCPAAGRGVHRQYRKCSAHLPALFRHPTFQADTSNLECSLRP